MPNRTFPIILIDRNGKTSYAKVERKLNFPNPNVVGEIDGDLQKPNGTILVGLADFISSSHYSKSRELSFTMSSVAHLGPTIFSSLTSWPNHVAHGVTRVGSGGAFSLSTTGDPGTAFLFALIFMSNLFMMGSVLNVFVEIEHVSPDVLSSGKGGKS